MKLNISERTIGLLLKFFNIDQIKINIGQHLEPVLYEKDRVYGRVSSKYLKKIQDKVTIANMYSKYKKYKTLNGSVKKLKKE